MKQKVQEYEQASEQAASVRKRMRKYEVQQQRKRRKLISSIMSLVQSEL